MSYAESKFLIYTCWDSIRDGESTVSGSLLLDHAMTQEEADQKVGMYKEHASTMSYGPKNLVSRYVVIKNYPYWWPQASN